MTKKQLLQVEQLAARWYSCIKAYRTGGDRSCTCYLHTPDDKKVVEQAEYLQELMDPPDEWYL